MASWFDDRPALWRALDAAAHRTATAAHPENADLRAAAETARQHHGQARSALTEARRQRDQRLQHLGPAAWTTEPEARLAELEREIAAIRQKLTHARARGASLKAERPAIPRTDPARQAQPADRLTQEHEAWRTRRNKARAARWARAGTPAASGSAIRRPPPPPPSLSPRPRGGPAIGR